MKKVYLAPQFEAIKILANSVLMASPTPNLDLGWGGNGYIGPGE